MISKFKLKLFTGGNLGKVTCRLREVEASRKEIEASGIWIPDSTQRSKISDTSKNLGSLGK